MTVLELMETVFDNPSSLLSDYYSITFTNYEVSLQGEFDSSKIYQLPSYVKDRLKLGISNHLTATVTTTFPRLDDPEKSYKLRITFT
jgi:hypothetical protein